MMELSLTVNGRRCTLHVDPATTLVEVLRDELGLTGTKIGCDRGACSACTVWLDGEVVASCMTFALISWPDVQKPHCGPSCSTNACWRGSSWSPCARPSTV